MGEITTDSILQNLVNTPLRSRQVDPEVADLNQAEHLKQRIASVTTATKVGQGAIDRYQYKSKVEYKDIPEPIVIKPKAVEPPPPVEEPKGDPQNALDKINAMKRELIKDSSLNGILTGTLDAKNLTKMSKGTLEVTVHDSNTGAFIGNETGKSVDSIHETLGKAKVVFGSNITLSESDNKIISEREQKYDTGVYDDGTPYKCPQQTVQDQSKNLTEAKALKAEILKDINNLTEADKAKVMSGLDDIFKWIAADSKFEMQEAKNNKTFGSYWTTQTDPDFAGFKEGGSNMVSKANVDLANYGNALKGAEAELSGASSSSDQLGASRLQAATGFGSNSSQERKSNYIDSIKEDADADAKQIKDDETERTQLEEEAKATEIATEIAKDAQAKVELTKQQEARLNNLRNNRAERAREESTQNKEV